MTDTCQVANCDNPLPTTDNSPACPGCWARHRQRLAELPSLIDEATITLTRQSAAGSHNTTKRGETPLPYSEAASDALTALHGALRAWASLAADEGQRITLTGNPSTTTLAKRLLTLDYYQWPHTHDAALDYIDELRTLTRRLEAVTDIRPQPSLLGVCPTCETHLYTRPGAPAATCQTCGETHTTDDIRAYARAHAPLVTIADGSARLRHAGYLPLDARKAARKLTPSAHTPDGQPLYHLTDLQHLATSPLHVGR
jgi:hypothetical protein